MLATKEPLERARPGSIRKEIIHTYTVYRYVTYELLRQQLKIRRRCRCVCVLISDEFKLESVFSDEWAPVTTAWRVLRLRVEEWPPYTEGFCEDIE